MKKYIAIIFALFLLSGCAGKYQSLKLGQIDSSNKSITVPGAGNALFEIKAALINDGWKIKVGDASLLETGTNTSNINSDINSNIKLDNRQEDLDLNLEDLFGRNHKYEKIVRS